MSPREYVDLVPLTIRDRSRSSPFSYACGGCSNCCYGKVIRVGPYEVLRLSRKLGISTTILVREYTEAGGTVLRTRDDRSCVFLDGGRCSVHSDRPFACRIYPLTWHIDADGNETFGLLEGHPESAGELGTSGTVDEYCRSQGLDPHVEMVRRYIVVHDRLLRAIEHMAESEGDATLDVSEYRKKVDHLDAGELATGWLDVDAVVTDYCEQNDLQVPTDIDAIIELHMAALTEWIESLSI